ncbi:septum formation family protein [Frondihabitans sp. 4ASC-45]|uniref:septum formation family protein n=1 Tax=Frondihabitans sp. 4ASC-45 TaxID=3111636 RepID=UPI003C2783AC
MSDERRPGDDPEAESAGSATPPPAARESAAPATPTEPDASQTVPIVPRRLPSAEAFFGEPRPPRHSARVEPPATPAAPPPAPPAAAPPASPESPHPMSLDLSALRGQRDDALDEDRSADAPEPWSLSTPTVAEPLDTSALPAHDGRGETPTSDFGAVFGATPTAPVHIVPQQDPAPASPESPPARAASFTELISVPPADAATSSEPSRFDWTDLPPVEPASREPEPLMPEPVASEPVTSVPDAVSRDETPTVAAPVVWSLDDLDPEPAATPTVSTAAAAPDRDELPEPVRPYAEQPGAATPSAHQSSADQPGAEPLDPADDVDAVAALFGEDARPEVADPAAGDLPPGGPDGAWADEPVDPELPVTQAMSAVPAETDAAFARPDPASSEAPTVAFVPPVVPATPATPVVPVTPVSTVSPDAPTRVVPVTPTERPLPFGGASSRTITPIDVSKAPAAWASAAPVAPTASTATPAAVRPRAQGGGGSDAGRRRILLFVGIAVAFIVVLAALFFFGRVLAGGSDSTAAPIATATPKATATSTSTATPKASSTPTPKATAASGLAAPGVHPYTELGGGECLSAFTDAWQSSYTVVDCGTPHVAQLVYVGALDGAAGSTYPGAAALEAQVSPQCQSDKAINLSAAQAYTDVQVSDSFPSTAEEWAAGSRTFYCFVNRTGGEQLSSSLAP